MDDTSNGVTALYGGSDMHLVADDTYIGTYPPSILTLPAGPYVAGLFYDSTIELLPPNVDDAEGAKAGDMMRIIEAYIYVQGSQRFSVNGYTLSAYQVTDLIDQPPPAKNGAQKFNFLGWESEPTIIINQPDPLPLDILAARQTVAF
jgi:hypothetical protein